jgi:hypothetical protein
MGKLSKPKLIEAVLQAVRSAGRTVVLASSAGTHPVRFTIQNRVGRHPIRAYIWNLSHGGGSKRPKHEYRIQITSGVRAFEQEPQGTTLILGWGEQFGVFAAFDASRRSGALGASPSIQISEATLRQARDQGAALQDKGHGEFAVAVRPDRLAAYIDHIEQAHAGDLTAILQAPSPDSSATDSAPVLDDDAVDKTIATVRTPRFGTPRERAQRRSVLQRLEELERELEKLRPTADRRGHNKPPELLQTDDSGIVDDIKAASKDLRGELSKPAPGLAKIGKGAKALLRISKAFKTARTEASAIAKTTKDKARERAAELVITVAMTTALALGHAIASGAYEIVVEIIKWLQLL